MGLTPTGLGPSVPPVHLIDMKASHHYWDPPSRHQDIFLTVKLTTHRRPLLAADLQLMVGVLWA